MRYYFFIFVASSLFSLPQGLQVVQGEAQAHGAENHLQIHAADRSILHWKDFSIAPSERVQFIQPSSASAVLNRVQGELPSQILGQLSANGKVYLINPNGVIFGKDATILVSSLFVSTLDCSDAAFSLNQELLFQGDSREAIINYGTITALEGNIALLGRVIENQGTITAPCGEVHVTAGQEILIRPQAAPILTIRPNKEGTFTHAGTIEALAADLQAEGQAYAYGMNIEGTVLALNPVHEGGKLYLKAEGVAIRPSGKLHAPQGTIAIETGEKGLYMEGAILAESGTLSIHQAKHAEPVSFQLGTLDVSGPKGGSISIDVAKLVNNGKIAAEGALDKGGSIAIHTQGAYIETCQGSLSANGVSHGGTLSIQSNLSLFSSGTFSSKGEVGGSITFASPILTLVSAEVNASGRKQGGSIQVGASCDVQTIHLGGNTHLSTSSTQQGNGGRILISSEERTICYGSIEARGGALGGDGGKIEVSGKKEFGCYATLSASAPAGTGGTVLFDPQNIVIDASTGVYPQYSLIDPSTLGTGFGNSVALLSTGNIVVTKPSDSTAASTAGAVYLYNGLTAALISTLLGSTAADQIGATGVTVLTGNGNYVIRSSNWDIPGGATNVGAVTWGSGTTGISGSVSSSNSLVGSTASDTVGSTGVTVLTNGNYVVRSTGWDIPGGASGVGAVTWGSGTTGISGAVSSSNSLIGSTAGDAVGTAIALTNGNYVVGSSGWDIPGGATNVGAVAWGDGTIGITGAVSASNSLVGSTTDDRVGLGGVTALTNGNYVVGSSQWNIPGGGATDVGAVTWGDGTTGITGAVSSSNSLVGSTAGDSVGNSGVTALTNGNYVVRSSTWDNGAANSAGAATWGSGTTGITGAVSVSNSLVGSSASDSVSSSGVTVLTNGNYVVASSAWSSNRGAVTWGDGTTGITGAVSSSNSLVGSAVGDRVGLSPAIALTNGNYVARSQNWANGAVANAGAATWGNGTTGITGAVSTTNSLYGSTTSDLVTNLQVVALTNGNYVIASNNWDIPGGGATNVGAVTWGDGTTGVTGAVSSSNSLIGSTAGDAVGSVFGAAGLVALTNGNYVVRSPSWNNGGGISAAGAVTWGNGTTGITGAVSASNSLVGSSVSDSVGSSGVTALTNGNYVVGSSGWDGTASSVGAATWGNGTTGITGAVSSSNSLVGSTASDAVSNTGVTALANGNYVVLSASWDGVGINSGAATWGDGTTGITGTVNAQNSIVGPVASSTLQTPALDDTVNGTFVVRFTAGVGYVLIGLQNPNQMTFARAQAQTMTIQPSFITDTLNDGTSVTLQANNDVTLSSALVSTGTGALTMQAGRSIAVNANITLANASLSMVANDLLSSGVVDAYRDSGDATLSVANNVTIDTGTGNLSLSLLNGAGKTNSGSGNLTIGDQATLQCSGSGSMSLFAEQNNVVLGSNALLQTAQGDLTIIAGANISAAGPVTIRTTGRGQLALVMDNLFPTSPQFGGGRALFPQATLTTGGGKLLIYTSQRSLNQVPSTINGNAYIPGPVLFNSATEKWGIYYPHSSGVPFTIFYKVPNPSGWHEMYVAIANPFQEWLNFWNKDAYLGVDPFPPYYTPKGFFLNRIPSLIMD